MATMRVEKFHSDDGYLTSLRVVEVDGKDEVPVLDIEVRAKVHTDSVIAARLTIAAKVAANAFDQ